MSIEMIKKNLYLVLNLQNVFIKNKRFYKVFNTEMEKRQRGNDYSCNSVNFKVGTPRFCMDLIENGDDDDYSCDSSQFSSFS